MSSNITFGLSFLVIFSIVLLASSDTAYGAQTVNDRVEISASNLLDGVLFEREIKNIGDLDGDGINELAVIKQNSSTYSSNVLILFMNNNGTVRDTNEINLPTTASVFGASCLDNDDTVRNVWIPATKLAFVGDLDGDGKPTLAVGVRLNVNGENDAGGIFMLELDSDGTVDTCFTITKSNSSSNTGFDPADEFYIESGNPHAFFGFPLIVTDLNGDGQNELLVGANNNANTSSNLWPLFLNSNGGVSSHPAVPIFGVADIGASHLSTTIYPNTIYDGDTVSGGTKIVVSTPNEASIFIVNLNSTGGFVNSTQITGTMVNPEITPGQFGRNVAALGDMNNDGVDDIIVGHRQGSDTYQSSGEVYILYLNSNDMVKETQKISNETENTRTGSTPFEYSGHFGGAIELWTDIGNNAVISIGQRTDMHQFYVERAFTAPNPDDEFDPDVTTPPTTIPPPILTFIQQTALIQQLQEANNELQSQLVALETLVIQLQDIIQSIQNPTTTINPQNPTTTNNTQNFIQPIQNTTTTVQPIPADAVKPQAPNNLRIITGPSQVTLSWDEPEDGGAPITQYYVWWFDAGNNKQSTYYNISNGTTLTLTGMVSNEEYRFLMAAVNAIGIGTASNEVTVTPN